MKKNNDHHSNNSGNDTGASRMPSMSEVSLHFNKPIHLAAVALNISEIELRKLCRQHGVKRWPFYYRAGVNSSQNKYLFNHITIPSFDDSKPPSLISCNHGNAQASQSQKEDMFSTFFVKNNNQDANQNNQQQMPQQQNPQANTMAQYISKFHQDPQHSRKRPRRKSRKSSNEEHVDLVAASSASYSQLNSSSRIDQRQEPLLTSPSSSSSISPSSLNQPPLTSNTPLLIKIEEPNEQEALPQQQLQVEEEEEYNEREPKRVKRAKLPSISDLLN